MADKMPVLFIGHGSPMSVVLENSYTRSLRALSVNLPKPKAIMVISAHWLTKGTSVTFQEMPKTIHDFYGFPDELYALGYPCPGAPSEARRVTEAVRKERVTCSSEWGLDHASWAVLRHLYPDANVPVFEMSLAYQYNESHPKSLQYHYDLAKELAEFRHRGIMIIGSGNIVHNLGMLDFENIDAPTFDWAGEFDEQVKTNLASGNHDALMRCHEIGPASHLSVPTLDHYPPMIYAIALQEQNETLTFTHEGFQYGSISMRCFKIG